MHANILSSIHRYGSDPAGIFSCSNKTYGTGCNGQGCGVEPSSKLGCQGAHRCGNNPANHSYCGDGDPSLPAHTSLCSIPADSNLSAWNESAMANHALGYRGCMEYVGAVSYTPLRAPQTVLAYVCRPLLEKKKTNTPIVKNYQHNRRTQV